MELAPIVLFVYNRPWHTEQTLQALENNELAQDSILYIFADGAIEDSSPEQVEKIEQVRSLIRKDWLLKKIKIIERKKNWGLADNIVDGVTKVVNEHGKIIVLEDDIVTSPGFLKYMNEALSLYEDEDKVMHISGYIPNIKGVLPETFFYNQTSCWGWGTWSKAWTFFNSSAEELKEKLDSKGTIKHFNLNGYYNFYGDLVKNIEGVFKTWAIKWHSSVYLNNGLCLHPRKPLVNNIGFDGSGVNCGKSISYENNLATEVTVKYINRLIENKKARRSVEHFYRSKKTAPLFQRIKNRLW